MNDMTIGEAANRSGVSAKMIRHYETIGLIATPARQENNYRTYGAGDIHRLRFIRRAPALGYPVATIRQLLTLWDDTNRSSADVKQLAQAHAAAMRRKIAELDAMARTVEYLAAACAGDHRLDCPILEDLIVNSQQSAAVARDDGDLAHPVSMVNMGSAA